MPRFALFVLTGLLAACSTVPAGPPEHGVTAGHVCDASNAERFIGRVGSSETGAAIVRATNAAVLRWARPGMMLTMEYRRDRVTIRLGPDGKITSINCG